MCVRVCVRGKCMCGKCARACAHVCVCVCVRVCVREREREDLSIQICFL